MTKIIFTTAQDLKAAPIQSKQVIMVMPFVDQSMAERAAVLAAARSGFAKDDQSIVLAVHDTQQQGFVATLNQAFAATQSPWLGYMAQDSFAGRNWLALALQKLQSQANAALLGFNDGNWP